jgi:cytohesin
VNVRRSDGATLLHEAAQYGQLEMVDFLLAHGADLQATDAGKATALHFAADADNGQKVVEDLIRRGADVKARTRGGWTPLHVAANRGDHEMLEKLIGYGADVNARDGEGATPLHEAASSGVKLSVMLLLSHGADPTIRDRHGETARDYAKKSWGGKVASLLPRQSFLADHKRSVALGGAGLASVVLLVVLWRRCHRAGRRQAQRG